MLYAAIIAFRHWLYDKGYLRSYTPPLPTICVGNLAVGGTGKTPHVEYLVRLLAPRYRVAVLSRGYRRHTRGFVLADDASEAATIGDEAMQIHLKYPHVPVAVCADRAEGIRRLQAAVPGLEVVVLDDAFQHRAIRCGFNIVLTAYDRLYVHDRLLPWGRLRDLKSRVLAAQAVVVTRCPDTMQPIDKRVVDSTLHLPTYMHLYFSRVHYADLPLRGRPLLITGIARPHYLLEHVRAQYPTAELMAFGDHHRFTDRDARRIEHRMQQGFDFILTTEKDFVRLLPTRIWERYGDRIQTLPIEVTIDTDGTPTLDEAVLHYIRTFR